MKRIGKWLGWGLVAAAIGAIGLSFYLWLRRPETRIVLPDGSHMEYLGYTYGEQHRRSTWEIQRRWPFIERRVYQRPSTKGKRFCLWEFFALGSANPPTYEWVIRDAHGCEYPLYFELDFTPVSDNKRAIHFNIQAKVVKNLPLDGSLVRLFLRVPEAGIAQAMDIPLRLPRENLPQITPEPLPATRRYGKVELTLQDIGWRAAPMIQMTMKGTSITDSITIKRVWCEPKFVIREDGQPRTSWKVARSSIGGIYQPDELDTVPEGFHQHGLFTCWRQPAYRLSVELRHVRTGKRVRFEFMVPPPPEAELKKLATP